MELSLIETGCTVEGSDQELGFGTEFGMPASSPGGEVR